MTEQFTWVDIYQELADALIDWQDRQSELIAFLEELREQGLKITPLMDKGEDGDSFLLREIDPFTFFGVFNRGLREEHRVAILSQMKRFFDLQSSLPEDFFGIPVLNNLSSWFFSYQESRTTGDIAKLWRVFHLALEDNPLENKEFLKAFDYALAVRQTNVNLTMGLFWIRPNTFLNLDQNNRAFLKIKLPPGGLNSEFYVKTVQSKELLGKPFPVLSYEAWLSTRKNEEIEPGEKESVETSLAEDVDYWFVGAYWSSHEPADQTQRFLYEGIWVNGWDDRYLDEVKSMQVGDRIAIKAATTQKNGLPFDNRNKTISRMIIKAIGTIVANRGDGKTVEVEWDPDFQEKSWYFFTHRGTIWHLRTEKDYWGKQHSKNLIDFVWHGKEQDYVWYCNQWWGQEEKKEQESSMQDAEISVQPYSVEDMIASGVFLEESELHRILDRLRNKMAVILQGSPGVGKTFIARKLAFALMEEKDNSRLEMVQFHQSYSYDDFVRGYRPVPDSPGSFGLQNGIFLDFCQKAIQDPDREYVFIIDEINRGNLSLIFGELLMLIEADKRGKDFAVPLVYRVQDEDRFYIPSNLHLIGLMNLADRSLAMVDYALRRRFTYYTLVPQYESDLMHQWLRKRSMPDELIELISSRMSALNREIKEDPLLGENYQVGHSYFCPKGDNFSSLRRAWYDSIVETEIAPLLKEYWFDNSQKADDAVRKLLA